MAAINAVGTGLPSSASNWVIPATVPGAPTNVSATTESGGAHIAWTAPSSNGGAAITGYVITPSSGSPLTVDNETSCEIVGLTPGNDYTFTVAAINSAGTGLTSADSNSITPTPTVPGAPTNASASAGEDATATVTWTAPASNGGSTITGYAITPFLSGNIQPTQTFTSPGHRRL